jgi:hypothetical protein
VPTGELVKRDSELGTGIRGGRLLKCRQACMVSELGANGVQRLRWTKRLTNRTGASKVVYEERRRTVVEK